MRERPLLHVERARLHPDRLGLRVRVPAVEGGEHLPPANDRPRAHEDGIDVRGDELGADVRRDPWVEPADVRTLRTEESSPRRHDDDGLRLRRARRGLRSRPGALDETAPQEEDQERPSAPANRGWEATGGPRRGVPTSFVLAVTPRRRARGAPS